MLSRLFMESDTVSTNSDEDADLALSWSGRWSLAHRILAVNILTILLVALSTLYLDVLRNRLSKERVRQTRIEATATAQAILAAGPEDSEKIMATISKSTIRPILKFLAPTVPPAGSFVKRTAGRISALPRSRPRRRSLESFPIFSQPTEILSEIF